MVIQQQCHLIGRRRALVGYSGDQHSQSPALEALQRRPQSRSAFQIKGRVGRLAETGHGCGREVRAQRDHQIIVVQVAVAAAHARAVQVNLLRLRRDQFHIGAQQTPQVFGDLLRPPPADHYPQQRGGEYVFSALVCHDDAMLHAELLAQRVGGYDAAHTAAQNENCLAGHCFSPLGFFTIVNGFTCPSEYALRVFRYVGLRPSLLPRDAIA